MKRTALIAVGIVLHLAAWNLGLAAFLWFGTRPSPIENYGIILGWGLALYVAGLYRTPLAAMPLCMCIYMLWALVISLLGIQRVAGGFPLAISILIIFGRAFIFATPIALNWLIQTAMRRSAWLRFGDPGQAG